MIDEKATKFENICSYNNTNLPSSKDKVHLKINILKNADFEVPFHIEDFEELVFKKFYIDKTLLIKKIFEVQDKIIYFNRPQKTGKTVNITMLNSFFNPILRSDCFRIRDSSNKNTVLFKGGKSQFGNQERNLKSLQISYDTDFMKKYHGKTPIVYFSFSTFDENYITENIDFINNNIFKMITENLQKFTFLENYYEKIIPKNKTEENEIILISKSLNIMFNEKLNLDKLEKHFPIFIKSLRKFFDRPEINSPILLFDDIDKPLRYYEELTERFNFEENLLINIYNTIISLIKIFTNKENGFLKCIFSAVINYFQDKKGKKFIIPKDGELNSPFNDFFGFNKKNLDRIFSKILKFDVYNNKIILDHLIRKVIRYYSFEESNNQDFLVNPFNFFNFIQSAKNNFKRFLEETKIDSFIKDENEKELEKEFFKDLSYYINNSKEESLLPDFPKPIINYENDPFSNFRKFIPNEIHFITILELVNLLTENGFDFDLDELDYPQKILNSSYISLEKTMFKLINYGCIKKLSNGNLTIINKQIEIKFKKYLLHLFLFMNNNNNNLRWKYIEKINVIHKKEFKRDIENMLLKYLTNKEMNEHQIRSYIFFVYMLNNHLTHTIESELKNPSNIGNLDHIFIPKLPTEKSIIIHEYKKAKNINEVKKCLNTAIWQVFIRDYISKAIAICNNKQWDTIKIRGIVFYFEREIWNVKIKQIKINSYEKAKFTSENFNSCWKNISEKYKNKEIANIKIHDFLISSNIQAEKDNYDSYISGLESFVVEYGNKFEGLSISNNDENSEFIIREESKVQSPETSKNNNIYIVNKKRSRSEENNNKSKNDKNKKFKK